ncbi:MAG TPA: hypothetical protein VGD22_17385 [Sphingobacteriaceae bacterium]
MKRKATYILICIVAILSACSKFKGGDENSAYKKSEGGMLYKIVEDKDTPEVGEIAFVSVSYTEATENGTLISQTGKLDPRPSMLFARMPEFKGDFQDALQFLSEGDSAVIKIRIDSLKKKNGLNLPESDTSEFMVFNVRINKVINKNGEADTIYPQQIEKYKTEQAYVHKATEKEKIKKYLSRAKQAYITTASGLLLPSNLKLSGGSDRTYKVNYAFYTLDGKIMDTNREGLALSSGIYSPGDSYKPLEISRRNAPILAFKEVLSMSLPDKKINMIIPSSLAFGDYGNSKDIPAYMPLVCEFEIVN